MSASRFSLFIVLMLAFIGGVNAYVHRRVSRAARLERRGRRALAGAMAATLVAMLAGRFADGRASERIASVLVGVSWDIELAILIAASLLTLLDLAIGLGNLASWARRSARAEPALLVASTAPTLAGAAIPAGPSEPEIALSLSSMEPPPIPSSPDSPGGEVPPTRREFMHRVAVGSALLVGGGSTAYGGLFGRHDYAIEEIVVRIPGLSPRLEGLTLVQLSDLHLGLFVGASEMRAALELTRRARPDLVVLTGDLIDHEPRYAPGLTELVQRLGELAPRGVFAIPGNHDHYTGIDAVLSAVTRGGGTVLRNANRLLGDAGGKLALLGVDDVTAIRGGGGPDLARAAAGVPDDVPRVLLCHNPVFFPEASGKVALQLSGHTHGGQVNLLVRPGDLVLPHGYVAGRYARDGSTLYVNRGFGTAGPPARIGAPPEVSRIVLVSA
ncbi:MAG TPA: metallophosphoesterase [Polyangiaceae bacterium]